MSHVRLQFFKLYNYAFQLFIYRYMLVEMIKCLMKKNELNKHGP